MQTIRWFHVYRQPGEVECDPAVIRAVERAAERAELRLESSSPRQGWVSSVHSRDGKAWPCREQTNGARPAWVWGAS